MTKEIILYEKSYIFTTGDACKKPCLIIGLASIPCKGLSASLRSEYNFIVSDIYWGVEHNPLDLTKTTLDSLVDDIEHIRVSLGFEKISLLSHSAFGLLALAYALKYSENVSEVIAIASPPCWTKEILANDDFFEKTAPSDRRSKFLEDQLKFKSMDLKGISKSDGWIAGYNASNAKYWYNFKQDNAFIWQGVSINTDLFQHFFNVLLRDYDKRDEYVNIPVRIFLALGKQDYVVHPRFWVDDLRFKDSTSLFISCYENSAHYPMLEDSEKFTKDLIQWSSEDELKHKIVLK